MGRHGAAAALAMLVMASGVTMAAAPEETPARYVVGFTGAPSVRAGDDFHGARVLAVDDALRFAAVVPADPHAFEAQASRAQGVRYVERDPVMQLVSYTPDDPRYPYQTGPQTIGAPLAWDTTRGASGVTVCIVDTGARYTHEDLAPGWAGGYDFVNGDADPWDDNGHGTHVSGIAAAAISNGKGIAGVAGVSLKHAKALDASGAGAWSTVASAIRWCADQGAASIGLSLGGTSGSTALQDAVDYASSKGAVVAAASGNDGAANGVRYPARYANAIAVGCVYASKGVCTFSNQGPELDLVAPGSGIESTYYTGDATYARLSGTSMSTPHVAGAAALLKSAYPGASGAEIRRALETAAEDLGAAGLDATYGHGLLRVDRAMAALASAAPAPAPTPAPEPAPVPAPEPTPEPAPAPAPTRGVDISPSSQSGTVALGGSRAYVFTVTNTGDAVDTYALSLTGEGGGWKATLSATSLTLEPGASASVTMTVKAPKRAGTSTFTLAASDGTASDAGSATTTSAR